jgi:hypothetical protein
MRLAKESLLAEMGLYIGVPTLEMVPNMLLNFFSTYERTGVSVLIEKKPSFRGSGMII